MPLTPRHLHGEWLASLGRDLGFSATPSLQLAPLPSRQAVLSRYQPLGSEAALEASSDDLGDRSLTGHHLLTLTRGATTRRLVLKAKLPGALVRQRMEPHYRARDPRLADAQRAVSPSILDACHLRELDLAALPDPALRAHSPRLFRIWRDDQAQIFALVMELLDDVRHADTLRDLDRWTEQDLTCALTGLAAVHGARLSAPGSLPLASPSLLPFAHLHHPSLLAYQAELLRYNATAFPELFSPARRRRLERLLAAAPARHRLIASRPLTLIHGDFTPRNLCLRPSGEGLRLCAYDWELAQLHLPARDVVELLAYTLPPARSFRSALAARLLERYRLALIVAAAEAAAAPAPPPLELSAAHFARDVALALAELATFKLLVQGITHQLLGERAYFERLVHNTFEGLAAFAPFLEEDLP